jgi:hypothetical protein
MPSPLALQHRRCSSPGFGHHVPSEGKNVGPRLVSIPSHKFIASKEE